MRVLGYNLKGFYGIYGEMVSQRPVEARSRVRSPLGPHSGERAYPACFSFVRMNELWNKSLKIHQKN
jgi:hypothetical protein